MRIYNTLSRSIEEFKPISTPNVGLYACGPTVYDYQHIGHMRRYTGDDILIRVLNLNGYRVKHVMNITDVGHLTSDADTGEDKMEKGAKKQGISVWDVAKKFEKQFKDSCESLNIVLPKDLMHATDYIKEQIGLIQTLEEKGFVYKTDDGVYFDTSRFPDYLKLSRQNPDEILPGVRVDLGQKKNNTDFALWKFSPKNEQRQMEWDSPWGKGFPGWHIECSAMSMKALGETLDIHTGGVDHINIHHTNEIAQSEAATGKTFSNYFVHYAFLTVEGQKMSKSLGNTYTVDDIVKKGYDPLSLRYLYLQAHYRREMNFTWDSLEASQTALDKLRDEYMSFEGEGEVISEYMETFKNALNEDINTSQALAVLWEMIKSSKSSGSKKITFQEFDKVLGLGISTYKKEELEIPADIIKFLEDREKARKNQDFERADELRQQIEKSGYEIEDTKSGPRLKPLT